VNLYIFSLYLLESGIDDCVILYQKSVAPVQPVEKSGALMPVGCDKSPFWKWVVWKICKRRIQGVTQSKLNLTNQNLPDNLNHHDSTINHMRPKSRSVRKTDLLLNTSSIKSVQCPKSRTETDMLSKKEKRNGWPPSTNTH